MPVSAIPIINSENEIVIPIIPNPVAVTGIISPEQNVLASMQGHTHEVSAVNNLQSILDSKQPSGNYSIEGHTHSISAIDNLQTTLDSKQVTGDYATNESVSLTASNLQNQINSKQPSGDYVTSNTLSASNESLINLIDSKQPSGNYSVEGHTHVVSSVSGLQSELDNKLNKASYSIILGVSDELSVTNYNLRRYVNENVTISKIIISVGIAASGNNILVDIRKNGIANSINVTDLQLDAGSNSIEIISLSSPNLIAGDYLTLDVKQVGSSIAGSDLTVQLFL